MKTACHTITTYKKSILLDNGNTLNVIMTTKKVFDIIRHLDLDINTLNINEESFFIYGFYGKEDFSFDNAFEFVHHFGNVLRNKAKKVQMEMYNLNVEYPYNFKGGYTFLAGRGFEKNKDQITFSTEGNSDNVYAYVEFEWGGELDIYSEIEAHPQHFLYAHTTYRASHNTTILVMKMEKGHPLDYIRIS